MRNRSCSERCRGARVRLLIAVVVWVAAVFGAVAMSNAVAGSIHNSSRHARERGLG